MANVARLKKGADVFEVVVNPDKAVFFRQHPETNVADVLLYPRIYSDSKKGMLASEQKLRAIFNTSEPLEVAKQILLKGEIQLSAEYRAQISEQKRNRIIDIIRRQGIDPRTGAPHPPARIEAALKEAKVRIDEHKPAEQQVKDILKALMPILPIRLVVKEIQIIIPQIHARKAQSFVRAFCNVLKEEWKQDGSWNIRVEVPGGLETEFYDKLNSLTHGEAVAKLIEVKGEGR